MYNPFAIERPHATPSMLERQGSFRGFNQLNQASPFKRQLSLRVNDLPSNLERTRSHSLEPTDLSRMPSALSHIVSLKPPGLYFITFVSSSFLLYNFISWLHNYVNEYIKYTYVRLYVNYWNRLTDWITIYFPVFTTEFEGYDEGHYSLILLIVHLIACFCLMCP